MATRSASIIQSRKSNEAALQVLRKLLSPSCPSCAAAACPRGQPSRSHIHEDCDGLRRRIDSKLERGTADIMLVQGQAADEAVGEVRETSSFLRSTFRFHGYTPVPFSTIALA